MPDFADASWSQTCGLFWALYLALGIETGRCTLMMDRKYETCHETSGVANLPEISFIILLCRQSAIVADLKKSNESYGAEGL